VIWKVLPLAFCHFRKWIVSVPPCLSKFRSRFQEKNVYKHLAAREVSTLSSILYNCSLRKCQQHEAGIFGFRRLSGFIATAMFWSVMWCRGWVSNELQEQTVHLPLKWWLFSPDYFLPSLTTHPKWLIWPENQEGNIPLMFFQIVVLWGTGHSEVSSWGKDNVSASSTP
jgi:hypothetical protein